MGQGGTALAAVVYAVTFSVRWGLFFDWFRGRGVLFLAGAWRDDHTFKEVALDWLDWKVIV